MFREAQEKFDRSIRTCPAAALNHALLKKGFEDETLTWQAFRDAFACQSQVPGILSINSAS
jgi:hypothetical protein